MALRIFHNNWALTDITDFPPIHNVSINIGGLVDMEEGQMIFLLFSKVSLSPNLLL